MKNKNILKNQNFQIKFLSNIKDWKHKTIYKYLNQKYLIDRERDTINMNMCCYYFVETGAVL